MVKIFILFLILAFTVSVQKKRSNRFPASEPRKVISLEEVYELVSKGSEGMISKNLSPDEAQDPFGNSVSAGWGFEWQDGSYVLAPNVLLKPEYVQSLFQLDTKAFMQSQNANNFLDAKVNFYRKLAYDFQKKIYEMKNPTLSDWAGLNHPPIRQIQTDDLNWIIGEQNFKSESKRETIEFQKQIDHLSQSELSVGNKFHPFLDKEVVPEILKLIQRTKKTLWISALLYSCDQNTESITKALKEKASQGVDVRIMVDKTMQLLQKNNCNKELKVSGIKTILVPGMILKKSAHHVKLWMSDFEQGMFLGANIIDIQTLATGFNHLFHDSGVVVEGPVVSDMAKDFLLFWNTYKPEDELDREAKILIGKIQEREREIGIRGGILYQNWDENKNKKGLCRVVTQERHTVRDRISQTLHEYLKTAKKRIWFSSVRRDFHKTVENSHLGYNQLLLTTLAKARDENVQVEMIFNATTNPTSISKIKNTGMSPSDKQRMVDKLLSLMMMKSTDKALRDGSLFFEKQSTMAPLFRAWSYFTYSHIKNLMIDEDFVITGSYNPMDERSTDDAEIALLCQDKELNQIYSQNHARDLVNSIPYPFAGQRASEQKPNK